MSDAFLRDALAGLTAVPKTLPGKYLWDEIGSDLFDRICHSADYYPTAQETALLPQAAADVARQVRPGVTVVEFGSGASRKIRTLLDALPEPAAYIAIDISGAYLEAAIRRLAPDYPGIAMVPVCADYSKPVTLPVRGESSASIRARASAISIPARPAGSWSGRAKRSGPACSWWVRTGPPTLSVCSAPTAPPTG